MNIQRNIRAYKHYFADFIQSIDPSAQKKIRYVLDMIKTQQRINIRFVKSIRDGLYGIRAEDKGNIYRIFFIFDEGNIVIIFNGFQKKSQKTPKNEIEKALTLKKEYYATKGDK